MTWPAVRSIAAAVLAVLLATDLSASSFDHAYAQYAAALRYVRLPLVDYRALKDNRAVLDQAVAAFASPAAAGEPRWTRDQRMAFWINAYNAFTLRAILDHYPIRSGLFTLQPRNSIRQIDGVWTDLTWQAAGRTVTLDDIEHRILRPTFDDARIHFAVNCASISCPPLAAQPYRAETLDAQLTEAARTFLGSREAMRVEGDTLFVSSIFKWYGEDFVAEYAPGAPAAPAGASATQRAILGVAIKYGPPAAARLAQSGRARIRFLDYDWSLNDAAR